MIIPFRWVIATLIILAGPAAAQTRVTIHESGYTVRGDPVATKSDVEDAIQTKADATALGLIVARSSGPKTVFIGSVAPGYSTLADPVANAQMLAAGNIGLYQHANGNSSLTSFQRAALWATWGVTGVTATGQGESVGEVGGATPVPADYKAYFGGGYPQQVNMNILTGSGDGTGTYTAGSGDLHPGTVYTGYTSASDLVTMKAAIDAAVAAGARNVAIYMTPNGGGEDIDDPFATSAYWANVRAAALYGGGIALDVPPTYWTLRGGQYQSLVAQITAWANQQGIRSSFTVSPFGQFADSAGNSGSCGYDPAFQANTQVLAGYLASRNAMPSQWVVENYGPAGPGCGTSNDVATDTTYNSLNTVALYLARTTRPAAQGSTAAGVNGQAPASQMATVRPGPLRLADVYGAGSMAAQEASNVIITGGSVTGGTNVSLTSVPLFQNGAIVQGAGGAYLLFSDTSGTLSVARVGGGAADLSVATIGNAHRPGLIATTNLDANGAIRFSAGAMKFMGVPVGNPNVLGAVWQDGAGALHVSSGP